MTMTKKKLFRLVFSPVVNIKSYIYFSYLLPFVYITENEKQEQKKKQTHTHTLHQQKTEKSTSRKGKHKTTKIEGKKKTKFIIKTTQRFVFLIVSYNTTMTIYFNIVFFL